MGTGRSPVRDADVVTARMGSGLGATPGHVRCVPDMSAFRGLLERTESVTGSAVGCGNNGRIRSHRVP